MPNTIFLKDIKNHKYEVPSRYIKNIRTEHNAELKAVVTVILLKYPGDEDAIVEVPTILNPTEIRKIFSCLKDNKIENYYSSR